MSLERAVIIKLGDHEQAMQRLHSVFQPERLQEVNVELTTLSEDELADLCAGLEVDVTPLAKEVLAVAFCDS